MNRHTLVTVDVLDFLNQVLLRVARTLQAHHLLRVERTIVERRADLHFLGVFHVEVTSDWDRLFLDIALVGDNRDLTLTTNQFDGDATRPFSDLRGTLRGASLEELNHAGQTVGDVGVRHTTGVEGTHGQLGTRLTNGLGGDDTNCFTKLHHLVGREGESVAPGADTLNGVTGQRGADTDTANGRVVAQTEHVVHHQHVARFVGEAV